MNTHCRHLLRSLPFLAFAGAAAAQDLSFTPTTVATTTRPASEPLVAASHDAPDDMPVKADPKLNVALAPYFWISSMSGNTTIRGIKVDTDLSFSDILDDTNSVFGIEGAIDVRYDRLVFQFNGTYVRLKAENEQSIFRNTELSADTKFQLSWYELFAGYRFFDTPIGKDPASHRRMSADAFVGGRHTGLDLNTKISTDTTINLPEGGDLSFGQTREYDDSKDWLEVFVGARIGIDLSEHWSLSLRADVGGFGIDGSQFSWQTIALIGYRWQMDGWTLAMFGGFRALGQDYRSGEFGWDEILYGPMLGAEFAFAF